MSQLQLNTDNFSRGNALEVHAANCSGVVESVIFVASEAARCAAQTQKIAAHLAASEATNITLSTTPEPFDDIIERFETICQATKDCFQLIKIKYEVGQTKPWT